MCFPKQKEPKVAASAAPPPQTSNAQVKSYVKTEANDRAQGFGQGVGDMPSGSTYGSGLNVPTKNKRRKGVIGLDI